MLHNFIEENKEALERFTDMSVATGKRVDWVQGGGGNTSVKVNDQYMAIKASGFCIKDIRPDNAYAVIDYKVLSNFYLSSDPKDLGDIEKEGSAKAKENTLEVEGMANLRPSVEAGFHSILDKFVCHTHSIYANLACCSEEMNEIAEKAFAGADYTWGSVPYTDPGATLTFAIRDELARVEKKTGRRPSVILMQNHGIIVHDEDEKKCLEISFDANERLAGIFGITADSFPPVTIEEGKEGTFTATTPYLKEVLSSGRYSYEQLMDEPLYPDQIVFLSGTFFMDKEGVPAPDTCVADSKTGELVFNMDGQKALVIAETLTAVLFIMEHIKEAGYTLSTMGEAGKAFIANWESEKYRKSLAGKGKK